MVVEGLSIAGGRADEGHEVRKSLLEHDPSALCF